MTIKYIKQTDLLLDIVPFVHEEKVFGLYGGTALNLFVWDMLRFSTDLDLVFLPVRKRNEFLTETRLALKNILKNVKRKFPDVKVHDKTDKLKLFFQREESSNIVKIEVNFVMRQSLGTPSLRILCQKARDMFQKTCEMMVLPVDQLYGSKMVVALDRQHP